MSLDQHIQDNIRIVIKVFSSLLNLIKNKALYPRGVLCFWMANQVFPANLELKFTFLTYHQTHLLIRDGRPVYKDKQVNYPVFNSRRS